MESVSESETKQLIAGVKGAGRSTHEAGLPPDETKRMLFTVSDSPDLS